MLLDRDRGIASGLDLPAGPRTGTCEHLRVCLVDSVTGGAWGKVKLGAVLTEGQSCVTSLTLSS